MHAGTRSAKHFKKFGLLLLVGTVLVSLTIATVSVGASTSVPTNGSRALATATHPIQYWIGCPPAMVDDGKSLSYFQQHGFTTVCLVVPDEQTYQSELNTIKSYGMTPIIDIEVPIWNGGQVSAPISNFAGYFQSLKNAGWLYVASEGGRSGDLEYLKNYFLGYVNFNCDQCGLWGPGYPVYTNSFTVVNSWESYYPSEWPYIQNGSKQAAAVGIQNGLLAGVWANNNGDNQILANSVSGTGTPSYLSMLNWSYENGVGFTSFHVWCGLDADGLSYYQSLHLDSVVATLQSYYPPTTSGGSWGWSGWSSVGGQLASSTGPAVSSQGSGTLDVFAQGTDQTLWSKHWDGSSWSGTRSLGGKLTSSPAAISPSSGVIDVFVRGTDNAVWEKTSSNGGSAWSAWTRVGGTLPSGTSPSVCAQGSRLDLFVQGTDGALWHKPFVGGSWSGWECLTGKLTSSPAAISPSSGVIDVFVRGSDGVLWERTTTNASS